MHFVGKVLTCVVLLGCGRDLPDGGVRDGATEDAPPGADATTMEDAAAMDAAGEDATEVADATVDDAAADAGDSPDAARDAGDAATACSDEVFPPDVRRIAVEYESIPNARRPFGESTNGGRLIEFGEGRFMTVRFQTPNAPFRRRLVFVDAPTSHNFPDWLNNGAVVTISRCPGDFAPEGACRLEYATRGRDLKISTHADEADAIWCKLEADETYYLNFISTGEPYSRAPTCRDSPAYDSRHCAVFFSETAAR